MKEVLKQFDATNNQITSHILADLIADHAVDKARMVGLYERYRTDSVPIMDRTFDNENKINNQLNNAFDADIVDTKVGYFAGYPISYEIDDSDMGESMAKSQDKLVKEFNQRSNIADLDSETIKKASICGLAGRLLYIDSNGQECAMLLNPWEVIPIYDRSINELQYAIRYYEVQFREENETYTLIRAEWYDKENVTFFIQDKSSGTYVLDDTEPVNPMPHLFDEIPIIMFVNNEEMQGDAEKVLKLIDGYDKIISDVNSEIEEFRLAYLLFYGYEPTQEILDAAKRSGAFGMDVRTEGVGVEYLTKDMKDAIIENHLNRLEENIMRFAKTVNMTDESFGGNLTGVAIKYKLMALENKCITLERKMMAALQQQFKVLATAWAKKGIKFDYLSVYYSFKRNLPVNILEEADVTGKLKGMVSEKTRLGLLSFVDDVEWEMEEMEADSEGMMSLFNNKDSGNGGAVDDTERTDENNSSEPGSDTKGGE